ncbi:MAG: 6-phosphogluconolactonase [Calditrichia bacterium]
MKKIIKIFENTDQMAAGIAEELRSAVNAAEKDYSLALSGGSTPVPLFEKLAQEPYRSTIQWAKVQIFWADERCVPPDSAESNYGMADRLFLNKIDIPEGNVHRIHGEADPRGESLRYSGILREIHKTSEGIPRLDLILLGMGTDGHMASLFPDSDNLKEREKLCVVARHPQSGQPRISLTLPVINNAARVWFMISGKDKNKITAKVIAGGESAGRYPAGRVNPENGELHWYLDKPAAEGLNRKIAAEAE